MTRSNEYDLEKLIEEGQVYDFYGVYNNFIKLGNLIFEVVEDPVDGYRSCLDSIPLIQDADNIKKFFFKRPIAKVKISNDEDFTYFISGDHVWLTVGTVNDDSYYPCFVFTYNPDQNQMEFVDSKLSPELLNPEKFI